MVLALLELLENPNRDGSDGAPSDNNGATEAAPADVVTDVVDVPTLSTAAGPVPGILILRQKQKRKLGQELSKIWCDQTRFSITAAKKKDTVIIIKPSAEPAKENEVKTDATITTTAATADEETGSSNNSNTSNSSTESNANEAANSNESTLNTSTGSNSSGVSSNSSNAPGNSNNGANGSGDANGAGGSGSGGGGGAGGGGGVHMKEQLIYLSKLLEFEVSSVEIRNN